MASFILPFLFDCSSRWLNHDGKGDNIKSKQSFRSSRWPLKWSGNEFSQRGLQDSPAEAQKTEILKQNSHSFLAFTLISLLLSLSPPVSLGLFPLWNYGNCLLPISGLQPDSLSSYRSNVHRLSLDLNLSQNQSHSQATQPFCIPTSPLCLCQDKNACWMPMRDMTPFPTLFGAFQGVTDYLFA